MMTRNFSIVAIVAMLATTLCLSTTTSAIPVSSLESRDVASPAQCIQQKWNDIKMLVPYASPEQLEKVGSLLDNGKPIEKPTVQQIEEVLGKFTEEEQDTFLRAVQCKA